MNVRAGCVCAEWKGFAVRLGSQEYGSGELGFSGVNFEPSTGSHKRRDGRLLCWKTLQWASLVGVGSWLRRGRFAHIRAIMALLLSLVNGERRSFDWRILTRGVHKRSFAKSGIAVGISWRERRGRDQAHLTPRSRCGRPHECRRSLPTPPAFER